MRRRSSAKQFGKRGIALHLEKQCTKVEENGGALTVHFGDGETVEADLMLVSVGRGPNVEGIGLEGDRRRVGKAQGDRRRRAPADDGRAHLRSRRTARLLAARAHGVSRGRGCSGERLRTRGRGRQPGRFLDRSTPILRSQASASPKPRHGSGTGTTSRPECSPGWRTRAL